jgi:hypothetical protein
MLNNAVLMNLWTFMSGGGISSIVSNVAAVASGIIALFLIIAIVKSVIEYSKGSGSGGVGKIIGQVVFLVICIGLVYLATKYNNLKNTGSKVGSKLVNVVNEAVGDLG